MTFWPTFDRPDDRRVGRAVLRLVPVAGQVPRRVDDHGAAAVLDAPERVDLGREQVPGPPDGMLGRAAGGAGIPASGKISFISRRKPWSNSLSPQQASAKRKPPCSTYSRMFCLAAPSNSGARWPLKKRIGAWSRSCDRGIAGVHDLPGEQALPVARDHPDEVADIVGVVVPVVDRAMAELVDQHRRPALGQEQQREARRDQLVLLVGPCQNPESGFWSWTSSSAPSAIPVVLAEEPDARRAGRPAPARRDNNISRSGRGRRSGRPGSGWPASRCRAAGSG